MMQTLQTRRRVLRMAPPCGFTLIELMVAITLGLLLSVGLVRLFGTTSKANRVQEAMAELQENGRYAISRINSDLRMVSYQRENVSGFVTSTPTAAANPNGVVNPTIAADVYVASIALPDYADASGILLTAPSTAAGWATNWPAATPWPLSQRYMVQGYECSSGTCTPALPSGTLRDLPTAGTAAGNRLSTADVLTVRYLNANGWTMGNNELLEATSGGASCTGGTLTSITLAPLSTSAPFNFLTGDLALLIAGSRSIIFQVSVAGNVLAPAAVVGGSIPCFSNAPGANVTLYNFSRDLVTVTYYVQLDADPNVTGRVIPALVRRQSTIGTNGAAANDQEIVQGVEQLDILAGIQRVDGTVSYLTSDAVVGQSTFANCPPEPQQVISQMPAGTAEPGCLWRAMTSLEAHVLLDSLNNMYDLTPTDTAYQYTYGYDGHDAKQIPAIPLPSPPSLLTPGNMLRREFVSLVSVRNYNP